MADNAPTTYVAREADLDTLKTVWKTVLDGESQTVHLSAPLGGGKRAIVGELCRSAIADTEDDVLLWRVNVREEDEGMAVVLRASRSGSELFQLVATCRPPVASATSTPPDWSTQATRPASMAPTWSAPAPPAIAIELVVAPSSPCPSRVSASVSSSARPINSKGCIVA